MEISPSRLPLAYSPSMVFSHGRNNRDQTFCTISDGCSHNRSVPEMRGMYCAASSYGWLVLQGCYSNDCYLYNPLSLQKIQLPTVIHPSYALGALTCDPTHPDCIVFFLSLKKKSFIFCRIGDDKWIQHKLKLKPNRTIQVISCGGKIYLFLTDSEEMMVIEFHGQGVSVQLHELTRPKPCLLWVACYGTYFVESCGEILALIEIHFGRSSKMVMTFEAFKLDLTTLAWAKVNTLGDRIILLDSTSKSTSTSFSATNWGIAKGSCIYYCLPGYTHLYMFDMEDGTIQTSLPCRRKLPHWDGPFCVVPTHKVEVKKEVKAEESLWLGHKDHNRWEHIPEELFELIVPNLYLGDCTRFRLACKSWKFIIPPLKHCQVIRNSDSRAQNLPWLMSLNKDNAGECKFHHPIYSDSYTKTIPQLAGAVIRNANYGWLLMSKGKNELFFFNPFTMEIIQLPDMEDHCEFVGISFSAPPNSTDFVVFGCVGHDMRVYRKGEETWSCYSYWGKHEWNFSMCPCNPVFCDGIFYCLGIDGKLGMYDTKAIDEESRWKFALEPTVLKFSLDSAAAIKRKSFIVECNGDIYSFFVDLLGKPIGIFKLDRSKKQWGWSTLENIGDKVVFVSHCGSVMVTAGLKGVENRIYLPRFHNKDTMFYSLSTGSSGCFGSQSSREEWTDSYEYEHCAWIQSIA